MTKKELLQLFKKFASLKVMVIGDVMIDAYLHGKVERISPEAPVPVVALRKRENKLGGAANVALNLRSFCAQTILCSVIGNDRQGEELINLMQNSGLQTDGILKSQARITTTKFRIIGNKMQILRVDEEIDDDLSKNDSVLFLGLVSKLIKNQKPDIIILQDYNKGVLTENIIQEIIRLASIEMIPVVADPKKKNFSVYKGIGLFKPNLLEITEGLKMEVDPNSMEDLRKAASHLHESQEIELVMITLSEYGVFMSQRTSEGSITYKIPAFLRKIADVSGAGDTVISVAALCLAAGCDNSFIGTLSNLAGGLVCEQAGVIPIDKSKLVAEALKVLC